MSLTASMWTSVSGLLVHGEAMNVVGNNISNVNTVGFKGSRMDFQDFVYQEVGTAAGIGQVGRGTSVGIVMKDFSQAAFQTTTTTTDIAIGGNGFFQVKPLNDNTTYYTRAGNFRFNKDGYLVDPHGYALQGWKVDNESSSLLSSTGAVSSTGSRIIGSGTPVDIKLDKFSVDPRHTTNMTLALNLDSAQGNDKSSDPDDPFFSLLKKWDATPNSLGNITPLGSASYAFSSTMEVFDEGGQSQKLTIYFDRVTQTNQTNISDMTNNQVVWEYIVTMDPSKDQRNFDDTNSTSLDPKLKGLLMAGTLTFDSTGQMRDQTAYVPTTNGTGTADDPVDLDTWVQSPISASGFPMFNPNFTGRPNSSNIWDTTGTNPVVNRNADGRIIELNLGLRSISPTWDPTMPPTADWSSNVSSMNPVEFYKVERDSAGNPLFFQKSTSAVPVPGTFPDGAQISPGPLITWTNYTPTSPGEVADTDGFIFKQKAVSQGLKAGEAAGTSVGNTDWVYKGTTASTTPDNVSGYVFFQPGTPANRFVLNATDNLYYPLPGTAGDVGQTAAQLGFTPVAEPNETQPISTTTPVMGSNPKFKTDSAGQPIQATQTSLNPGMGQNAQLQNPASTSFTNNTGNNFFERFASQDGYTFGELRNVSVNQDGVLSASYSNGVTLELYQITLADFHSKQNMRQEGGNLFTETRESGMPITGAANTGTFGTTNSNSLEQSNVDLSREFVNMITTQKGFQANSKTITTVDTMLDTVIQMKR